MGIVFPTQSQNKPIDQFANKSLVFGSILLQSSSSLIEVKNAEVQLVDQKDNIIETTLTSENGKFMMKKISFGKYFLKVKGQANKFYSFKDGKPQDIKYPVEVKEHRTNLSETVVYPIN